MNLLEKSILILRYLGPSWGCFRLRYALMRKTGGLVRRSPLEDWPAVAVEAREAVPLFFASAVVPGPACVDQAEEVLSGRFRLFSCHVIEAGFPPDWRLNQLTGERAPEKQHWSEIGDFAFGDIKGIWELSRFPWAFCLARAYARTRDDRYASGFWVLFDDWMRRNPPNYGANWKCGQEATFRLMAATFARQVFANSPATTTERCARFRSFALVTGRRIAANLDYALSQSNNHGVSECVGLITAALLLPGVEESVHWRQRGLAALERQLDELVYADGAFSQHSANYQRVLMHNLLWCISLLRARGEREPAWLTEAALRALAFLTAIVTVETGRVPLYGANDGADILPLADGDYLDFCPLVQAGIAVLHGVRRLPSGPWDEAAEWLTGKKLEMTPTETTNIEDSDSGKGKKYFPDGGCLHWPSGETRLFFRCPTHFHHRPSQADLLHADIEWRGQPIAQDAGTFSYNTPGQFSGAMKDAALHNTITFDQGEPMTKVGRFLYLPWPRGEARWDEAGALFEATHDGWKHVGLAHSRRIRSPAEGKFVIEDSVKGAGRHRARLHWLLADEPHEFDAADARIVLQTARGAFAITWAAPANGNVTLVRAEPNSARGWCSPYYFQARPALSLTIEFEFEGEAQVETRFAPIVTS